MSFCTLGCWHTEEHKFNCEHKVDSSAIDVVFCMDTTGSMSSYIENSKIAVLNLMDKFSVGGRSLKFGFVSYKDHPPEDPDYVTLCQDLTDHNQCKEFIDQIYASGGGDAAEAVLDGIYDATTKLSWRKDSIKLIFHIGDAPPHGNQYTSSSDNFPGGCPCGYTIEMIASEMEKRKIKYRFLIINSSTN